MDGPPPASPPAPGQSTAGGPRTQYKRRPFSGCRAPIAAVGLFCSRQTPRTLAVQFDIPPTLRSLGATAQVAELLAIHAGLHLLHTLQLRGTVCSDCLSAVNKITRRWSPATLSWKQERHSSPPVVPTRYIYNGTKVIRDVRTPPPSAWSRQQCDFPRRQTRQAPGSPNRAVAAHSTDPQASACPICHRFWSQAHLLCGCPSTTDARLEGSLDLTIATSRLPPGPCWTWAATCTPFSLSTNNRL